MNTLFVNPIIVSSSIKLGRATLPVNVLLAMLIVFNAIGLISFLIILFLKYRRNSKYYKSSLDEIFIRHWILCTGTFLAVLVDICAILSYIIDWVSALL